MLFIYSNIIRTWIFFWLAFQSQLLSTTDIGACSINNILKKLASKEDRAENA